MPAKQSYARPVALITGASSGIGEALAHCFADAGHDLVLVARSADKLKALASTLKQSHDIHVWVEPTDLAASHAAAKLFASLKRKQCQVDVLVNCAGVLEQNAFSRMTPAQHQQIIDLNISGLTAMLAHFLPPMLTRGAGRILNVASIAAFQPIPLLATYAASKAYVLSLSESLAEETKDSGVTVTALCPGITATHMLSAAKDANAQLSQIPGFLIAEVADVARQGFEACMKGDAICVPGVFNQAAMIASRSTPKWLVRRIGGLFARRAL
ncbi:SDR family oxidoreductase [Rhodoferax sp.]|uniref:SDR family NAD(P)-dependent oxidoreductase n=1 Tax=Rhodoferax sp. TaxID=50421 RepID=UPI001EC0B811|nr:SDR family oxidoreductase [Rhodoferax sp.]MBT9508554.1 SDR family oxidoreductase [Rhodoferax sp.]